MNLPVNEKQLTKALFYHGLVKPFEIADRKAISEAIAKLPIRSKDGKGKK